MSDPVTRLNTALEGRYRIERELGEGGMATVYLAEDLRHERWVAIKVLKPELAAVVGADRFLAEIKTTAKLHHPHILPLFDSGEADSYLFYVMPHVEGESLRQRLDRERQLPVDDAIRIAKDLAEALDYAHGQGVIHRDIKPANVLLLQGKPVISDFGIALALGTAGGGRLTETGLSLGTPQYMSPEQAMGDAHVGPATDVYALGCVLYEMLVGEPPYTGGTQQAILGRILAGEFAAATQHRPSVPANVDAAVRKALEKLPADRFTGAHDFARALSDPGFRYGEVPTVGLSAGQGPWNRFTMTALASVLAVALGWLLLRPEPPAPVARFSSPFEEGQAPTWFMELTADGSALVYVGPGESGQGRQLWVRRWADLEATPIRGTEAAMSFALSPDEHEVAFADFPGSLRVVSLDGGSGRTLVDSVGTVSDWTPDGTVYFSGITNALGSVPATGGGSEAVKVLTELRDGEAVHAWLRVLPGGTMGVFWVLLAPRAEEGEIWALNLDTGERRFLISGNRPQYAATGHLLFGTADGVLMAAPIDPATAELKGPAVPMAEGLLVNGMQIVNFAVSESGTLVYDAAGLSDPDQPSLLWIDRDGLEEPIKAPQKLYGHPRISPDGARLAIDVDGDESSIWIWDFSAETLTRLNLGDGEHAFPVWKPDGERVAYESGPGDLGWMASNNTGTPQVLAKAPGRVADGAVTPHFFTPDGTALVFGDHDPRTDDDLVMIAVEADAPVIWRLHGDYEERNAELSPDGRWMAYQSDESGVFEIYVRPFPKVEADQVQVSNSRGLYPLWSRDGRELFYFQPGATPQLMSVTLDPGETDRGFAFRGRKVVMGWPYLTSEGRNYDVSPDGQRFVAVKAAEATVDITTSARVILVQNFFEELKARVRN